MALLIAIPIFLIALIIALAIGAALLKLACRIIRAEVPPLGGAMWVLFVAAVVQFVVIGGLTFLAMGTAVAGGGPEALASLGGPVGGLINLGSFALVAFVYWRMLGLDSYWWALLLHLVHSMLGVVLAVFIGVGLVLVGGIGASQLGDLAKKGDWAQVIEGAQRGEEELAPAEERALGGTVYKWTDRDGRTQYSEKPPPPGTDFEVVEMAP